MARQSIKYDPSEKLFESYLDFSGGLVSEIANERLRDNEFPVLENVDLSSRGSAKRRSGRELVTQLNGTLQAAQFYNRHNAPAPDIIVAISGRLYVKEYSSNSLVEIAITHGGSPFTFQTDLPFNMEQYRDTMFIPTGTRLVELKYDTDTSTWKAVTVTPYAPTTLEVLDIGTNALSDNPNGYVNDGTGSNVKISGMILDPKVGVVNQQTTATAYVEKPEDTTLEYYFQAKGADSGNNAFNAVRDWSLDKSFSFTPSATGTYNVTVNVRKKHEVVDNCDAEWANLDTTNNSVSVSDQFLEGTGSLRIASTSSLPPGGTSIIEKVLDTPIKMSSTDRLYFWMKSESNGAVLGDNFYWQFFKADGSLITAHRLSVSGFSKGDTSWRRVNSYPWSSYQNQVFSDVEVAKIRLTFDGYSYLNDTDGVRTSNYILYFDDMKMGARDAYLATYSVPNYQVKAVYDPNANGFSSTGINSCRMIRIHWERLLLTQDAEAKGQIYVSDALNPRYFPTPFIRQVAADKQEPINALIRYKDMLVVFTKTTITAITGKSPWALSEDPYRERLIHDGIGCIAPRSAQVVGNEIFFLSYEGVHTLRPSSLQLENLNVKRIDYPIKSEIKPDENACSMVYDGQYWLAYPNHSVIYRFYYDSGMWVKDVSSKLNVSQFLQYVGDVYNLSKDGKLYKHNEGIYHDDNESYSMKIESKMLDLSASFNYKRLKKLYVLAQHYNDHHVDFFTTVYADANYAFTPEHREAVVGEDGYVRWDITVEPNMHFYSATQLGVWELGKSILGDAQISVQKASIRGKCRRVKVTFVHSQPVECEIYGFGLEFRLNKP